MPTKQFFIALLLVLSPLSILAQVYPVQSMVQLLPPHTPALSNYTAPGSQRFVVQLRTNDLSLGEYAVKLRLTIEGVGITIKTKPTIVTVPILLPGGAVPLVLYGEDIREYFEPANLDFAGISRTDYQRTGQLPEGVYRFTVEALDFNRNTVVSNKGMAVAWMILNDPPLLNLPGRDTKLRLLDPTNIPFTWTPRHTASPNAAFTTEYVFRIVEIWPAGRNPYDAFLSQPPLYEVTTSRTQIVYGMGEPALIPGRKYAWQVQALDTEGRDLFKNQGRSEVFVFQYGDELGVPENVRKEAANQNTVSLRWDPPMVGEMPEQYRVQYRATGATSWQETVTQQTWVTLAELQPAKEYEVQVRSERERRGGAYTIPQRVRTTELVANADFSCGTTVPLPTDSVKTPLQRLFPGDIFSCGDFNVVVTSATTSSAGVFQGTGMMKVEMFSGASVEVTFSGPINRAYIMTAGYVQSTYQKGSAIAQVIDAMHSIGEETRQELLDEMDSVAATETITLVIQAEVDSVVVGTDGKIEVITEDGTVTAYEQTKDATTGQPVPTVVQDASGDQWLVKTDEATGKTTVTKVEGSGTVAQPTATMQTDPVKDKIIELILAQFDQEIGAWLSVNGKGGEEDEQIQLAGELPAVFPRHAGFLTHVKTEVIPFYREQVSVLTREVEVTHRDVLDRVAQPFKNSSDVDWSRINGADQETLRSASATALLNIAGGEIDLEAASRIVPACGRTHAGKDKPLGTLFLISYPQDCKYALEHVVNDYISKGYGKYLCVQERFNLIQCLATGVVSNNEEVSIITLIEETPQADVTALLSLLKADKTGVLKDIEDGFDFGNYVLVFQTIRHLYMRATSQVAIDTEVQQIVNTFNSDKTRAEKAQQNYFTWFEGGILKAVFSNDFVFSRFDDVAIGEDGTVSFRYATAAGQTGATATPISLKPFALVGMRVYGNTNAVLEAGGGNVVYVPAIMLPLLISKANTASFFEALNATMVVSGVGAMVSGGTRLVIATGGLDVLLGTSTLIVDAYQEDIQKIPGGKEFLEAYDLVNKAILVYFSSRAILQTTQALPKLRDAFNRLKATDDFAKLKTTNASKATAIEREVDDILKKGDDVAKGADELASLVKRFDNLTPDELKQLYSRISKSEINSSSKITRTQKDILAELEQRGITNPYNFTHPIEDITLSRETIFIRIHSPTNQARPWLVAIEDFKGFTSTDDLVKKLALPVLDNSGNFITQKISLAKIPAGTKVRKSVVRPQDWPGQGHQPGGATQFEIIEQRATETWFKELGNLSEFK